MSIIQWHKFQRGCNGHGLTQLCRRERVTKQLKPRTRGDALAVSVFPLSSGLDAAINSWVGNDGAWYDQLS